MPDAADARRWLRRLVGEWTHESTCDLGPDAEPSVSRGTERVEAFGEHWVVADGRFAPPGHPEGEPPMRTRMTLGWDPRRERFVGTWIGTHAPEMFVYEGILDEDADRLVLATEGRDFTDESPSPRIARYRDAIEFVSADRRVLHSSMQRADGTWHRMLESVYTRTG